MSISKGVAWALVFQSFPDDFRVLPRGNQCLPGLQERPAAESSMSHLQPGEVTLPPSVTWA